MIKIFRHIRRSLINNNQMGKYFKYAIGEILLVVIGILIALQVNNWNETRKMEKNLQNIYGIIESDLEGDIDKIQQIIEFYNTRKPYVNHVLDNELTESDYTDSTYFNLITYAPRVSVTTRGFDLLINSLNNSADKDSLQVSLTEFYNSTISRFEFLQNYMVEDIEDNFSNWKDTYEWYPDYILNKNLDEFIAYTITNPEYKNRVANYYFVHYSISINYLNEFIYLANEAINLIHTSND